MIIKIPNYEKTKGGWIEYNVHVNSQLKGKVYYYN